MSKTSKTQDEVNSDKHGRQSKTQDEIKYNEELGNLIGRKLNKLDLSYNNFLKKCNKNKEIISSRYFDYILAGKKSISLYKSILLIKVINEQIELELEKENPNLNKEDLINLDDLINLLTK